MKTLDDIRAAYPHLGTALYAYTPLGPVTLEILPPDGGKPIQFVAQTEAAAVALAFPDEEPEPAAATPPAPTTNVFD